MKLCGKQCKCLAQFIKACLLFTILESQLDSLSPIFSNLSIIITLYAPKLHQYQIPTIPYYIHYLFFFFTKSYNPTTINSQNHFSLCGDIHNQGPLQHHSTIFLLSISHYRIYKQHKQCKNTQLTPNLIHNDALDDDNITQSEKTNFGTLVRLPFH